MTAIAHTASAYHYPLAQVASRIGGLELHRLHEICSANLALWKQDIAWINARLFQIDPKLVGEIRDPFHAKFFFRRLANYKEIKNLQSIKAKKQDLINQVVDRRYEIESHIKKLLNSPPVRLESNNPFKGVFSLCKSCLTSAMDELTARTNQIRSISQELFFEESSADSPEASQKLILTFFDEMPIFKNDEKLRAVVASKFRLPEGISVSLIDPNTLQIDCKQKLKGKIDLDREITKEECEQIDSGNPRLETNERITVNDLRRFGTIDPEWWDWLKVKNYPSFGPTVVIKREQNTLHFLKGSSLLSKIEFRPDGISFKALMMQKALDWSVEDFFLFLTKFTSV